MAKITKEFGKNANFYLGDKLVFCAENIEITTTIEEIANKCQGNVGTNTARPGDASHSWSASGVDHILTGTDLTTDVSGDQFHDIVMDREEVTIIYGGPLAGDAIKTGVGYIREIKLSAARGEDGKYNISGWFNSLTAGTRPA